VGRQIGKRKNHRGTSEKQFGKLEITFRKQEPGGGGGGKKLGYLQTGGDWKVLGGITEDAEEKGKSNFH